MKTQLFDNLPKHLKKTQERNVEAARHSKELLLAEMKERNEQTTKKINNRKKTKKKNTPSPPDNEIISLKNQIRDLNKELKKAKKEAANERKKNHTLKKENKEQLLLLEEANESISHKAEKSAADLNKAGAIRDELIEAGWDIENDAQTELHLRNEIIECLIELIKNDNRYRAKDVNRIRKADKNRSKLEKSLKTSEQNNKSLQRKLEETNNKLRLIENEIVSLDLKYQRLRKRYSSIKSMHPREIILRLMEQLTSNSFNRFNSLNLLFERYNSVFKNELKNYLDHDSGYLYGYLEYDNSEHFHFRDINDEIILPLTVRDDFKRKDLLIDGIAVQVRYCEDSPESVTLVYCYPIVEVTNIKKSQNKKTKKTELKDSLSFFSNEEVLYWAKDIKLVVIGNKSIKGFCEQLGQYVKKLETIDTYEKGEKYTYNSIRAADYIFVDLDSVPHSVSNFISRYDPQGEKVNYFHSPKRNDGLVRLNYLFWQTRKKEEK